MMTLYQTAWSVQSWTFFLIWSTMTMYEIWQGKAVGIWASMALGPLVTPNCYGETNCHPWVRKILVCWWSFFFLLKNVAKSLAWSDWDWNCELITAHTCFFTFYFLFPCFCRSYLYNLPTHLPRPLSIDLCQNHFFSLSQVDVLGNSLLNLK